MSQFVRTLARQPFFQAELAAQPELKAALDQNTGYALLEREGIFVCLSLQLRSARLGFDFQHQGTGLPDYLSAYLACFFAVWPESLSPEFFAGYLKQVMHSRSEHNSARFKNYFIHQLDALLQAELGLSKPRIGVFRARDRQFFEGRRGESPGLLAGWQCIKVDASKAIELAYLAWRLYLSGKGRYPISAVLDQATQAWSQSAQGSLWPKELLSSYIQMREYLLNFKETPGSPHFLVALARQFVFQIDALPAFVRQVRQVSSPTFRAHYEALYQIWFQGLSEIAKENLGPKALEGEHRSALQAWQQSWDKLQLRFPEMLKQPEIRLNAFMIELEVLTQPVRDLLNQFESHEASGQLQPSASGAGIHVDKYFLDSHGRACAAPDWADFFKTPQEVVDIESQAQEIWVLTPHFIFDTQTVHDYFGEVVTDNMQQGKIHRYFHTAHTRLLAQSLARKYAGRSDQIYFHESNQLEALFACFKHEMVLYDPLQPGSAFHCGFYLDILDTLNSFQSRQVLPVVHLLIPARNLLNIIGFLDGLRIQAEA